MSRPRFTPLLTIAIMFFTGIIVCGLASSASAEDMTMSPHKIVLNSRGLAEDIQAVIRMPMAPGYSLADFLVTLSFNDVPICDAITFRYCLIDANFLAGFDRNEVLTNPAAAEMAGTPVLATVSGWFTAINNEGESYTQSFEFTDDVIILDPGQNSSTEKPTNEVLK